VDRILNRLLETNFSELPGAVADAVIPVPETLINELIQAGLPDNGTITALQVSVHPENRISATVKSTLLPWSLNLKLKLDSSVDIASYASPKVRAWLENNRLLGSLGALFRLLPEGTRLYGSQDVVDLGTFLHTPEQQKVLALVKSIGLATEKGRLILDVHIEVD
jgi:hypothetical protein